LSGDVVAVVDVGATVVGVVAAGVELVVDGEADPLDPQALKSKTTVARVATLAARLITPP